MNISQYVNQILWMLLPIDIEVKREIIRDRYSLKKRNLDDNSHLMATAEWLIRAHSANNGDGVSRGYRAAGSLGFGPKGWQPSYPETTGYIIPTMFTLSGFFNDESLSMRAIQMADWEISIQLPSGAVMASVVTAKPSPAVFNTGQVVFGWLAAFKETGDQKYLDSAIRAGDFLLSVQETDGSWKKGNSRYALEKATTYNTRVAWALIELGRQTNQDKYVDGGRKNIEFALTKQLENGWFSENCLNDPEKPLLHTIAYATRGVLEYDAAIKTMEKLGREVDVAIAYLHFGVEFFEYPTPHQVRFSRSLIDHGALLVLGHHSHVPQGYEHYKNGFIAYSLGNFIFDMPGGTHKFSRLGLLVEAEIEKDGIKSVEVIPVDTSGGNPRLLRDDEGKEAEDYLRRLSSVIEDKNELRKAYYFTCKRNFNIFVGALIHYGFKGGNLRRIKDLMLAQLWPQLLQLRLDLFKFMLSGDALRFEKSNKRNIRSHEGRLWQAVCCIFRFLGLWWGRYFALRQAK